MISKFDTDSDLQTQTGTASFRTNEDITQGLLYVRISEYALDLGRMVYDKTNPNILYLGTLLHELFEADYNVRKLDNKEPFNQESPGDMSYQQSHHELYANKRALEMINEIFGNNYKLAGEYEGFIVNNNNSGD